jgi:adenylate kinase
MGVEVDAVLSIEVADEAIIERMSGRRICSACGASYHVVYNPPKTQDVCDACSSALYVRADDAAETVISRLNTYHEITEPLKEFYEKKGVLVCVKGMERVEDTTANVFAALEAVEAKA